MLCATEQGKAWTRALVPCFFCFLSLYRNFAPFSGTPLFFGARQEDARVQLDEKALLCLPCVRPPLFPYLVVAALLHHMLSLQLTLALFFVGRNGTDVGFKAAALATLGLLRLRRRCGRTAA